MRNTRFVLSAVFALTLTTTVFSAAASDDTPVRYLREGEAVLEVLQDFSIPEDGALTLKAPEGRGYCQLYRTGRQTRRPIAAIEQKAGDQLMYTGIPSTYGRASSRTDYTYFRFMSFEIQGRDLAVKCKSREKVNRRWEEVTVGSVNAILAGKFRLRVLE